MSNLYWLSEDLMGRLRLYFPISRGRAGVDDRRILSGIVFINRNGLRWCDAPKEYGPYKILYNHWKRWSDMGVFARIMEGLAANAPDNKMNSIDATYLKAHRTASSLRVKKGEWMSEWPYQRRYEHETARSDRHDWRPIRFFITAGQVSDYTGAKALVSNLPAAEWLLGDRGYDANWFRESLVNMGTKPCIPEQKSQSKAIKYERQ